jgi:hypothetical protein
MSPKVKRVRGARKVIKNLNREIRAIQNRSRSGMAAVGFHIRAAAIKLTPIDTGHLRATAGIRTYQSRVGWAVIIYYTAKYAAAVHEKNKNYKVGQWKFLEVAIINERHQALRILQRWTMIR